MTYKKYVKILWIFITELTGDTIEKWGLCLMDCPYHPPVVSCLAPPPLPKFGTRNSMGIPVNENYHSSWFNISFINNTDSSLNHSHYKITRYVKNLTKHLQANLTIARFVSKFIFIVTPECVSFRATITKMPYLIVDKNKTLYVWRDVSVSFQRSTESSIPATWHLDTWWKSHGAEPWNPCSGQHCPLQWHLRDYAWGQRGQLYMSNRLCV